VSKRRWRVDANQNKAGIGRGFQNHCEDLRPDIAVGEPLVPRSGGSTCGRGARGVPWFSRWLAKPAVDIKMQVVAKGNQWS
jgi:hypothetical protein